MSKEAHFLNKTIGGYGKVTFNLRVVNPAASVSYRSKSNEKSSYLKGVLWSKTKILLQVWEVLRTVRKLNFFISYLYFRQRNVSS